jgi:hypothetical protein
MILVSLSKRDCKSACFANLVIFLFCNHADAMQEVFLIVRREIKTLEIYVTDPSP